MCTHIIKVNTEAPPPLPYHRLLIPFITHTHTHTHPIKWTDSNQLIWRLLRIHIYARFLYYIIIIRFRPRQCTKYTRICDYCSDNNIFNTRFAYYTAYIYIVIVLCIHRIHQTDRIYPKSYSFIMMYFRRTFLCPIIQGIFRLLFLCMTHRVVYAQTDQ